MPDRRVSWDERREPGDPRPWEWAQILEADAATLERFAGAWADSNVVFAVVGERDRVGMDALKALGTVHEVERETLFGYGAFPDASKAP